MNFGNLICLSFVVKLLAFSYTHQPTVLGILRKDPGLWKIEHNKQRQLILKGCFTLECHAAVNQLALRAALAASFC